MPVARVPCDGGPRGELREAPDRPREPRMEPPAAAEAAVHRPPGGAPRPGAGTQGPLWLRQLPRMEHGWIVSSYARFRIVLFNRKIACSLDNNVNNLFSYSCCINISNIN